MGVDTPFFSDLVSNEVDSPLTHYAFICGVGVQLTFTAQKKVHIVYDSKKYNMQNYDLCILKFLVSNYTEN